MYLCNERLYVLIFVSVSRYNVGKFWIEKSTKLWYAPDFPSNTAQQQAVQRHILRKGLPDGIFSYQKSKFGCTYFIAVWNILRPFDTYILRPVGIVCGYLVYFPPFWYVVPKKSGNPAYVGILMARHRKKVFFILSLSLSRGATCRTCFLIANSKSVSFWDEKLTAQLWPISWSWEWLKCLSWPHPFGRNWTNFLPK
jgi:hypothetical protein